MKDVIKGFVCGLVVVIILSALLCSIANAEIHVNCGTIIKIDQKNDTIEIMDMNGEIWQIYYEYGWKINDKVIMFMNDLNTISIYDDEIVNIRPISQLD